MFKATQPLLKTNKNKHQIKLGRRQRVLQKYQQERRKQWQKKWHPKPEARWMHKKWWKEAVAVQEFSLYLKEKARFQEKARNRVKQEMQKGGLLDQLIKSQEESNTTATTTTTTTTAATTTDAAAAEEIPIQQESTSTQQEAPSKTETV